MKKASAAALLFGVLGLMVPVIAPAQGAKSLKDELVGTWEVVALDLPKGIKHIKHITPTHFTWIFYDADKKNPQAVGGGTWSVKDNAYTERFDFASESFGHLRDKELTAIVKVDGDQWSIQTPPGSNIVVKQVWKRLK